MSDRTHEHWESVEKMAFEQEGIFFGSEPEDIARLALRSNAYAKTISLQNRAVISSQERLEERLVELNRAVRILIVVVVLIGAGMLTNIGGLL